MVCVQAECFLRWMIENEAGIRNLRAHRLILSGEVGVTYGL